MSRPRFGVIYSRLHDIIPPPEFANKVEQLGFDSVWATEGLVNQLPAIDPVVAMAGLAQGCRRVTVGSCVILSPLRTPAIFAKEIASLDILSAGRIVLGIAVGGSSLSNPGDYAVSGVNPRERGERCNEGIEIMKKLWTGTTVSHRGQFYSFENICMQPKPVQSPHPPIWVGGNAEGAIKRAARFGDGFVPIGEGASAYAEKWNRLNNYAKEAGRNASDIVPAVHLFYCTGEDRDHAHALVERTLSERYGMEAKLANDGRFVLGSAAECAKVIESYVAAGVREFVLNTVRPLAEVVAEIEKFAAKVMPKFH